MKLLNRILYKVFEETKYNNKIIIFYGIEMLEKKNIVNIYLNRKKKAGICVYKDIYGQ